MMKHTTSIWIYRLYAVTNEANLANAFWTLIAPGGDPEAQSYGVSLSPSDQEPATHRGISSAFTAEMLAKLKVLETEMEGLRYYVVDAWTFELLEQRGGTAVIGEVLSAGRMHLRMRGWRLSSQRSCYNVKENDSHSVPADQAG